MIRRPLALALCTALTLGTIAVVDLEFSALDDPAALQRASAAVNAIARGMGSPDSSMGALRRVVQLAVQTFAIAALATGLGALFGLGLAVLSTRTGPSTPLRTLATSSVRLLLDVLRALPDFAWALALLLVLGPGPWTGLFAIALSVTGILGRAYGQLLDDVPGPSVRAIESLGASPLATVMYGRLPHIGPAAWSYGLARLECSIRNASVIGIVGGGGLGAELFEELGYGRMDRVATILIALIALTATADVGSSALRRRIAMGHSQERRNATRAAFLVALGAMAILTPDLLTLQSTLARLDLRLAQDVLSGMLSPDVSGRVVVEAVIGIGPPLALAWLATLGSALLALTLLRWTSTAVLQCGRGPSARPHPFGLGVALLLRAAALLLRAVPDVAWLLVFATILGMGTAPALAALTLHATGILIRLFTEAVDDRFAGAPTNSLATGAPTGWLAYVALPQLRGTLITHGALQAEANLRAAFTLGIIGAGGLGESFHSAVSYWQLGRASTLAIVMALLFVGLDRAGRSIGRHWAHARPSSR